MKTVIYYPPSPGCENTAEILRAAIAPALQERRGSLSRMRSSSQLTSAALAEHPSAQSDVDCVFFLERVIDHPALMKARHRVLIPNPEWLDPRSQALAANCTHVWHKSRFSLERLAPLFPQAQHAYLGFTSPDPGRVVAGHESFVHLRGKIHTQRNTDSIFAAWKSAPALPDLYVQCYINSGGGLHYHGWLHDGNVHVRIGWLERAEYLELAVRHGIHLCTSEVEGFGHYINEARAMGALVVTVDGSPMNELIDESSGILVRPSSTSSQNHGVKYHIAAEDLLQALDRALSLSPQARRELGAAARNRFLAEADDFRRRALELFAALD